MWRSPTISLGLILGLALWVRLHDLGRLSLWLDEGTTSYKMGLSLSELFRYTVVDNVPPLYYFLARAHAHPRPNPRKLAMRGTFFR